MWKSCISYVIPHAHQITELAWTWRIDSIIIFRKPLVEICRTPNSFTFHHFKNLFATQGARIFDIPKNPPRRIIFKIFGRQLRLLILLADSTHLLTIPAIGKVLNFLDWKHPKNFFSIYHPSVHRCFLLPHLLTDDSSSQRNINS